MVKKISQQTRKLIQKELRLIKNKFDPEKVILFGSRARGDFIKDSDVDLLVVSKRFKGKHFLDRGIEIYAHWDKRQGLDLLCYTPEEFNAKKKQIGIVQQAVKEGISV